MVSRTKKSRTKKSRTKKPSLTLRRLSSEMIASATSKQKRDLSHISLEMAQTHEQLIEHQKAGLFTEFMRDICKLNKMRLLQFCSILRVKALSTQSYKDICDKIINDRPDLFKSVNSNEWKKWGVALAVLAGCIIGKIGTAYYKEQQYQNDLKKMTDDSQLSEYLKKKGYAKSNQMDEQYLIGETKKYLKDTAETNNTIWNIINSIGTSFSLGYYYNNE